MSNLENISIPTEHPAPCFTKVIDGRTYQVGVCFAKSGSTFQELYERVLRQTVLDRTRHDSEAKTA